VSVRPLVAVRMLLAGLVACLGAAAAAAAELRGEAPVVDVVPLSGSAGGRDCHPPRPQDGGLAELLAWDLRLDCTGAAPPVTGYRVFYRWDGHTYSRVMARPPGATVPVRVRVN